MLKDKQMTGGYFNIFSLQPQQFLAKLWPHGRTAKIKSSTPTAATAAAAAERMNIWLYCLNRLYLGLLGLQLGWGRRRAKI